MAKPRYYSNGSYRWPKRHRRVVTRCDCGVEQEVFAKALIEGRKRTCSRRDGDDRECPYRAMYYKVVGR